MTITMHTIWVCSDCMFHEANGECSNCPGQTYEHDAHDMPPLVLLKDQKVSLGLGHSKEHVSDCAIRHSEYNDCDKECDKDDFSWKQCEGCGSQLGGDRHALTVWTEEVNPTDDELERMVRMDPGDSYNMHFPDGTVRCTGYTAEGPRDTATYRKHLRKIWNKWNASQ